MEIRSVTKAVRVIETLSESEIPLGVTELARITELDKSSVSRLLKTLVAAGYVSQDPVSKSYDLGLTLLHLGQKMLKRINISALSKQILKQLAFETEECVHIAILVNNKALYIEQAAPPSGISVDAPIGTLAPLHCTALGKVLFAFQKEKIQRELLDTINFEAFTRRSITNLSTFQFEIEKVKQNHVAYDDEEFSVGVKCMAVPVFKHDGSIAAAIGLSGPSPRVTDDKISIWSVLLKKEAEQLSIRMGWQKDTND